MARTPRIIMAKTEITVLKTRKKKGENVVSQKVLQGGYNDDALDMMISLSIRASPHRRQLAFGKRNGRRGRTIAMPAWQI
jgi:hypothetical protein